ncbi:hypothetical protein AC1031_018322 [Aphanomyces cochlioides]|nr:hypothetical protein AC1031_018322 [Aphanomyces cochlioides]
MDLRAFLLLLIPASFNALWTLTACPSVRDYSFPCLRDANNTTFVFLDQPLNQSFDFSGLDISTVEALPPNATYVNLSNNKISQLDFEIPSSLSFLNLSQNALSLFWLRVPLSVETLDVSYNQGGLSWLPLASWDYYLPRLRKLIYRGNKLDTVRLDMMNFPSSTTCSIRQIDLLDNPGMTIKMVPDVYSFVDRCAVFFYFDCDYNKTISACDGDAEFVQRLNHPITIQVPTVEDVDSPPEDELESPAVEYICVSRQFAPAAIKPDIVMPSIEVTEETGGMSNTAKYALLMGGVFGFFIIVYIIAGCVYKHKEAQGHYRRQATAYISKTCQRDGGKPTGGSSFPVATLRFA